MKKLALIALALLLWAPLTAHAVNGVADAEKVTSIADVTVTSAATLVKAANGERTALSCTNNDASVHVRWGDSAITTTRGEQIKAGASIEIQNRGPIYMISESTDVQVSCTEETR